MSKATQKNIRKVLLIIIIMFPSLSFSQNIIGVWCKKDQKDIAIEFKSNGKIDLLDLKNQKSSILRNLTVTYKLKSEGGIDFFVQSFYKDGILMKEEENKYKIIDGKLYLPRTSIHDGQVIIEEYKDEYLRIK